MRAGEPARNDRKMVATPDSAPRPHLLLLGLLLLQQLLLLLRLGSLALLSFRIPVRLLLLPLLILGLLGRPCRCTTHGQPHRR
jgi:hypothetical protein